jgi:hypothetical protein
LRLSRLGNGLGNGEAGDAHFYTPTASVHGTFQSFFSIMSGGIRITENGQSTMTAASSPTSESSNEPFRLGTGCFPSFFEYETPKVVTVQNVPLGILRLLLQIAVVSFVVIYQLWYAQGYQEFAEVEASVTTKLKGFSL